MLIDRIKDIAKDSSIYGLSKILGQLISFFLIPVYTSYLTPADYGVLSMIGIASTSLALLMTFGIDSATYRYVGLAKDEAEQKNYVANAQMLTFSIIFVFTIFTILFISRLNTFLVNADSPVIFLAIGLIIGVLSTLSSVPRAYLRIRRQVKVIAVSSLINVLASIVSTILLVVVFKIGVLGALLGNLTGSLLSSLYIILNATGINFSKISRVTSKELLAYSIPALPAQVFAFTIPIYSQWSVKEILSLNQLGLYAVGLKFTLPISVTQGMFQQAYAPYKFEILKTDNNPRVTFSKIMSMYILGMGTLVLFVAFFGGEILKLMTASNYHGAAKYVFYIALIPLTQGLYFMMGTGLEFAKSPIYRPFVSGAGLLTVILINDYLVNKYGVPGAALSISLGWMVMAIATFVYAQTIYAVKYNWYLISGYLTIVIGVSYLLNLDDPYLLLIKCVIFLLVICFFAYMTIHKYKIFQYLGRKQ